MVMSPVTKENPMSLVSLRSQLHSTNIGLVKMNKKPMNKIVTFQSSQLGLPIEHTRKIEEKECNKTFKYDRIEI